ncbi:MAG: hypothetical protein ACJ790_14095 [Myxococcaceae bacterium]
MTPRSLAIVALLSASLSASVGLAQSSEPRVAVVLLQGKGLAGKEVEALLDAANDEVKNLSAYRLDPASSLEADNEAMMNQCTLDYDCLLRVAQAVGVDAVLGLRASPEGRKTVALEFLWVAADAKGLPGENERAVARTPQAMEAGVRNSLKKVLPGYALKGKGGITVLAEPGSKVLVDGENRGEAPLSGPLVVSAGVHRVDVVTPTGERVSSSVDVPEGRKLVADLPSPHPVVAALTAKEGGAPGHSLKLASYAVGGAAVLALGVGAFFGAQTISTNRQLRDGACSGTPCTGALTQVQAQDLYERASGSATGANIGVATGLLLGAGAGALFYLGNREEKAAPKEVAE